MVAAGLTACVPPLGCRLYVLRSVPVTVTWFAFVAVTVNVDEPPGLIDVGVAMMLTVGAAGAITVTVVVPELFPPLPVASAV